MQKKSPNPHLTIGEEVADALQAGLPVVALESTIICHGMPYPRNVETAIEVQRTVRDHGATPATVAIVKGKLRVGLSDAEIDYLGNRGQDVIKASRRDLPFVVSRHEDGATTVAATMIIAAMAGVELFATGGIGGVHRGVEQTMDVSADLQELARSPVAVVCAGVKSVLDIAKTLEYLETQGVAVIGYQTNEVPAFYARSSGLPVDYRIETPTEAAAAISAKRQLGLGGGMVIANPVPLEHSLDSAEVDKVIDEAISDMNRQGITGKATTPFLLARIAERTSGRSLSTNIQLVLNNARLAAQIAVRYTELSAQGY